MKHQNKNLENYDCILQRNINATKMYYESKFNKYVSNLKQTWTTINQLLNKCNNKKKIPKELKRYIKLWLEINKLAHNIKKKIMIFHHKQWNIYNLIPQLNLNGQIIERVTDFNF